MRFLIAFLAALGALVLVAAGLNVFDLTLFLLTGKSVMNWHVRVPAWCGVIIAAVLVAILTLLGCSLACGQSTPPVPFPVPAQPPISAGQVVVQNGHLSLNGQRVVFWGVNFDASAVWGMCNPKNGVNQVDPNQVAVYNAELDRMQAAGITAVRILGLDASNIGAIFAAGTTLSFDPGRAAALKQLCQEMLPAHGMRYLIPLHSARQLLPKDLPANASPLAQECVVSSFQGNPVGCTRPWDELDVNADGTPGTLQQLQMNFDTGIAQIVDGPACLGYELENENPTVKNNAWSFNTTTYPKLEAARGAYLAAWCTANGVKNPGQPEHFHSWADCETQYAKLRIANLRKISNALIIPNTYFGNGPYAMLQSSLACGAGTPISAHFYSFYGQNELTANGGPGNGYFCGQLPPPGKNSRPRFPAVLAGCSWGSLIVSEYGFQAQWKPNALDGGNELLMDLPNAAWEMVNADCDACFLYSWAHWPIWAGGVSEKTDTYQLRDVPGVVRLMRGCSDLFCDITLRPYGSSAMAPTGGLFGVTTAATATTAATYQIYGPYTDPALYAVPAATKIVMQLPAVAAAPASSRFGRRSGYSYTLFGPHSPAGAKVILAP